MKQWNEWNNESFGKQQIHPYQKNQPWTIRLVGIDKLNPNHCIPIFRASIRAVLRLTDSRFRRLTWMQFALQFLCRSFACAKCSPKHVITCSHIGKTWQNTIWPWPGTKCTQPHEPWSKGKLRKKKKQHHTAECVPEHRYQMSAYPTNGTCDSKRH